MSIEEDILIERFLKEELSETEKIAILERIESDASFKEKVLFEQQLFDTLDENSWSFAENIDTSEAKEYEKLFRSEEVKNIKETISKANENFKKKKPTGFKKWHAFSSAAVIAFLISLYVGFPKNQTSTEIYYGHLNAIELPSIGNRGSDTLKHVQHDNIVLGQSYFDNKEYEKVVTLFSEELKSEHTNSIVYMSLAISQMELSQFKDAEKTLDSLISSDLVDAEKGYWLKSLLYIKAKDLEKAETTLSTIIKNSYFNYKKAKKLLKEITDL